MRPASLLKHVLIVLGGGRWGIRLLPVLIVVAVVELHAPAALAFPYRAQIGATTILAEQPITPAIVPVLARADRLLLASPLDVPGIRRQVVLTRGGWRWQVLALGFNDAIALRRPFSNVLVFNHGDIAADRVSNDATIGGRRTLSGAIAHETVHLLVARRYGEMAALRLPIWKAEGYADFVAGESSGDARDETRIRAADPHAAVLVYYEGRRRVAAELRRNGGSVDALMAD